MHVTVAIPTRNRVEKLTRTIRSIPDRPWLDIVVGVDNDRLTRTSLPADVLQRIKLVEFLRAGKEPFGSVHVRNRLMPYVKDALLYACDDVEFDTDCIQNAVAMHERFFPDGDGLVGLYQNTPSFKQWGMGLLGSTFIDHFKCRHVFFPAYSHFAAHELGNLAQRRGRFKLCSQAKTIHYHPTDSKSVHLDQTHLDARYLSRMDLAIKQRREVAGMLWGEDPHPEYEDYEPWLREWIKQIWPRRALMWGSGSNVDILHDTVHDGTIVTIEHVPSLFQRAKDHYSKVAQIHFAHIPPDGLTNYATLPIDQEWAPFDLIFVNGTRRVECLLTATKILRPGGVVILHNADRHNYRLGIELFDEIDVSTDKRTRVLQLDKGDIHRADEPVLKELL